MTTPTQPDPEDERLALSTLAARLAAALDQLTPIDEMRLAEPSRLHVISARASLRMVLEDVEAQRAGATKGRAGR